MNVATIGEIGIEIDGTPTPWLDWLLMVPRWPSTPLDEWIEVDVRELIAAADSRRLEMVPTTKHFTATWATFRHHHEEMEDRGKNRRRRWLVWRAAALKVFHDRGRFQDVLDFNQCHDKLIDTLAWWLSTSGAPRRRTPTDRGSSIQWASTPKRCSRS